MERFTGLASQKKQNHLIINLYGKIHLFPKKILDLKVNNKINKLLKKSVQEGTSKAASIKGKKIYGKTGTSDGNKDLWFIGSLDSLTTGIWIGYDDNKESELSSGNAAYLWKKFISKIYKIPITK